MISPIRNLRGTAAVLSLLTALAGPARAVEPYTWSSVSIGGGGYITGLAFHPLAPDVRYARCDVGGVFRWSSTGEWQPLLDWVSPDQSNLSGCDGLAVHPQDPQVVFAMLGRYAYQSTAGLYKSTDGGGTWRLVLQTRCASNSDQRWHGEPLAIDPSNPAIMYCGTRTAGLFKSTDSGETWSSLPALPQGDTGSGSADNYATYPIGIRTLLVGPGGTIYAGLYYRSTNAAAGVYRSTDGGASFTRLSGCPDKPVRFAIAGSALYVTHDTGIARLDGDAWTNVTPPTEAGNRFCAIAVDPADANHLVVSRYAYQSGLALYRSTDGGTTWSSNLTAVSVSYPDSPWFPSNHRFAATACLVFDPHAPGAVSYGDWYAVWRCEDIAAAAPVWVSQTKGLETSVVVNLMCPPSSSNGVTPPLVSGFADIIGFRHFDHWLPPGKRLTSNDAEGISADFCESAPQNLAVVTGDDWYGAGTRIITSSDGGASWVQRGIPTISGDSVELGRVAVDCANPARMVYIPYLPSGTNARVYYSSNTGQNWSKSNSSLGGRPLTQKSIFDYHQPLCADRNTSGRFFLYNKAVHRLYRSTNFGQNWSLAYQFSGSFDAGNYAVVTTAPGRPDEVWISMGWQGLQRSSDGGSAFSAVSGFSDARSISWGKPASGTATIPYVFGKYNGIWGVWRSTDLAIWERVSDDSHAFGNETRIVAADRQVHGRVYLGSNGNGIRMGQPWPERSWEQWQANRFSHAQRSGEFGSLANDLDDPDRDGVPNLMEYAFGGDPVGANEEPGGGDACVNGGFENATLSPWGGGGSWGTFSRSTTQQRSGDACLRLQPSSACHQVLAGLVAGSTYRITAHIRCETGGSVRLGVKNHGAEETSVQTTATDYTPVSLDFTPTTGTTSAEVYLYSNSASGGAWVDDVTIPRNARLIGSFSVPTPAYDAGYVVDGGFEMDPTAAWGAAGSWGTSARTTSVSHTGAASLRLESPAASHQIIAGLEPSTTYVLTAYIRSETGGTVYLGVKNHGAAETNVSTTDATFSPVSLTFTTGPSSTGAEVYVWRDNSATGGAWIDTVSLAKDGAVGGGILDPLPAFDIVASGGYEWPAMHFNRMRPDVTYEVLGSDNLIDWPVVSTNAGAVNSRVTFLDAARVDQNPRRFLRMRVSRP